MDGNGRLGRLWQTLILGRWKPVFFMIPIESVIRDQQADYYGALRRSDEAGNSTPFIEYTIPDKPTSRLQKYRLTSKGRAVFDEFEIE